MRKILYSFLIICTIFLFNNTANAILTSQAPVNHAVWKFINTEEGKNPNYGINKKRFSQAPLTDDTVNQIYNYVKDKVNAYEKRAEIIRADVDVDFHAGKIFYTFSLKIKSTGEIIKLPVWTIMVQPRYDV